MSVPTQRQLVWLTLKKLPWLTLFILFMQCLLFLAVDLNDGTESLFALNIDKDTFLNLFAFNIERPWEHLGMTVLTSFFIHSGASHFFANLLFGSAIMSVAEILNGYLFLLRSLIVGHLAGLVGAFFAFHFTQAPPLAAGMSGGLTFIYTRWVLVRFGKAATILLLPLVISFLFLPNTFGLAHGFPLLLGIGLALIDGRSRSLTSEPNQPNRKSPL